MAIGICLLLFFEPLAFGGVPEPAILILETSAGLLFILWAAGRIAGPDGPLAQSPLFAPILLFAALIAAQLVLNLSAYWYATWEKSLLWAAYGILLFLVSQCLRREPWQWWFAMALTVYGFAVALFAIAQNLAGNGRFYWVYPNQAGGVFFGPYPNHAHYSGLMEMLIPFPLVFAMAAFSSVPVRVFCASAAVVMSSSVFLSKSRGGVFAFVVELAVLTILSAQGRRMRIQVKLLGVFAILLVLWLMMVPPSGLWQSFLQAEEPGPGRLTMLKDSVKMVLHRPLLGWGFGTFYVVYPSFRSFYTNLIVNAAHDDFVELAVETGLVGFALMIWFLYRLYRTGVSRMRHWRHQPRASVTLAALVGCAGLIAHSLMDFNLQVPANAALFFVLTAIATTSVTKTGSVASRSPISSPGESD